MKLLYLHGFRSNPQSSKAVDVDAFCKQHHLPEAVIPQLPFSPKEAVHLCVSLIQEHQIDTVCGSSLGGFYAMHLAEKFGLRCAVINPAVTPWNELKDEHLKDRYNLEEISQEDSVTFLEELKLYFTPELTNLQRYLLLVATGDEVLDPDQMRTHFQSARQLVVNGGTHTLNDFGGYFDELMQFLTNKQK